MARYTIKVPNNDEGEDLGEYEADYLPRVGDQLVLMHPRVNPRKDHPFCGVVSAVTHEAYAKTSGVAGYVNVTVWIIDEAPPPELFCDCTEEELSKWGVDERGRCDNCSHMRRS